MLFIIYIAEAIRLFVAIVLPINIDYKTSQYLGQLPNLCFL